MSFNEKKSLLLLLLGLTCLTQFFLILVELHLIVPFTLGNGAILFISYGLAVKSGVHDSRPGSSEKKKLVIQEFLPRAKGLARGKPKMTRERKGWARALGPFPTQVRENIEENTRLLGVAT